MIPQNGGSIAVIESDAEENLPSLTYKADFDKQNISGTKFSPMPPNKAMFTTKTITAAYQNSCRLRKTENCSS